jgi:hypothetical protein
MASAKNNGTKSKKTNRGGAKQEAATLLDETKPHADRLRAITELGNRLPADRNAFETLLAFLKDRKAPRELREAALTVLQAATFSVTEFEELRPKYMTALRAISDDPGLELRQRALGLLARESDKQTQTRLLEGLKDQTKALLPPEKALQLLSYDIHADAYPIAREIVKSPPNALAKREALRLLGADANSAPLFEKILRDKGESAEIRQICASALHAIDPTRLQQNAREIIVDPQDDERVKATSLTAITSFGRRETVANDAALQQGVDRLAAGTASEPIRRGVQQFVRKYR